ncbi:MAG TPA: shikimate kinase [Cytophagaceae bacterium]|nr:shikimate kinase [Cytophagaceae bacterium]
MKSCLYLVGMPGCGKSTLGKQFSLHSGYGFVDTDVIIIEEQKKSIEQIYAEGGEASFRLMEHALIQQFFDKENLVICTGGGLPCFHHNMALMNQHGITVFLDVSPEELWNRVKNTDFSGRPIYQDKTPEEIQAVIRERSKERYPFYSTARITLRSDRIVLEDLLEALDKLE